MSKVYIFLADGFEDIEGLTVVDLMRRAGIEITTVSVKDTKEVTTAHGITLLTDRLFKNTDFSDGDMLVLPGGMPGTVNLGAYEPLIELLKNYYTEGKKIAAICAAPSIFAKLGFLKGRRANLLPFLFGPAVRRSDHRRSGCDRWKCDDKQRSWYGH